MIVRGLDNVDHPFEFERILPEQFFPQRKIKSEARLMLAVLEEAIMCYVKGKNAGPREKRKRRLCKEVEEWMSRKDTDYIFSFANICAVLDINPSTLRDALMRLDKFTLTRS